jgi:hypothetical protein
MHFLLFFFFQKPISTFLVLHIIHGQLQSYLFWLNEYVLPLLGYILFVNAYCCSVLMILIWYELFMVQ